MEPAVILKALTLEIIFCVLIFTARVESDVKIDVGNSTLIELKAYVDDLKVAGSSAVYTSNLNLRYIEDLQTALQNHKVFCQSTEGIPVARPDYERVGKGVFYKLHPEPLTWNSARKKCENEGARLAVFINSKESESLRKILASKKISTALLGIHSLFEVDNWVTISSESIQDPSLMPQKVKDSSSNMVQNNANKRCGAITKSTHVERADCNAASAFFCEIRWKQHPTEESHNSIA